ncbi:MAG: hypothetical protein ACD_46C00301G0003 [uncultured bacterium]|nr:MAG: hypothetical protein ACD_46C00301G0003 [uncultured bacterium]
MHLASDKTDMNEKISNLVSALQHQAHLPLWALNNEIVIYSMAVNSKPAWGRRIKLLNFLITIADKLMLSDAFIFGFGLLRALSLWMAVKSKTKNKKNSDNKFTHIFFSFKVSSENYLYSDYMKISKSSVLKIDSVSLEGMQYFDRPKFKFILILLFQHAFGCTAKLKKLQSDINLNTRNFLTVCALNIGIYAFYRSYWRMLKSKNIKEIAFITLDTPLYACIDEGIATIYFQHGLLSRTLLIPKVNYFHTLTYDEEKYLKKLVPDVKISRVIITHKINSIKNNIIMILSPNKFLEDFYKIQAFTSQTIFNNQQIVIRPVPTGITEISLQVVLRGLKNTILDDTTIPLHASIEKWNPKFVVSGWMSTGLATALDFGCLPISLYDPNVEEKWMKKIYPNDYWNTIYPIKSRVLFWPRDHQIIKMAMNSQMAYEDQIKKLKSNNYHF